MDIDSIIDQTLTIEAAGSPITNDAAGVVARKRERLASVIVSGQSERYLGRAISMDQVDKLSDGEINKLYARYEMLFGASICKTLGHAVLAMYSDLAAYYRSKINASKLTADLKNNPVVEIGLLEYSGRLFSRFGLLLSPIAVALTTIKHCKFGEDNGGDAACQNDAVIGGDKDAPSEEP